MDTEVEKRILEFFEGSEFEKGPVNMELMTKEITLQQYLKVYRYILRRRNRINFLKAGNILISLTLMFAHKLDNFHEGVRKFLTSLQKIVHLPPVPNGFPTKRKLNKENRLDVFDPLCPLESINKRMNQKNLKDDNNGFKIIRANRAPCFKVQLKDTYVPSRVYNSQFEIIAEKRDLKIWGYLCERPVPQSQVCYPCTHVDDFNNQNTDTFCPSITTDRDESSMPPSHYDDGTFTKASEDDEMSLMNTTIRSDAEVEDFNNRVTDTFCTSTTTDGNENGMPLSHTDDSTFIKTSEDDDMSLMNTIIKSDIEVEDSNNQNTDTICPSTTTDRNESSMRPSRSDDGTFTKTSEDDDMSLMNTIIKSNAEVEDVLGDDRRRSFSNWLKEFGKRITLELSNAAVITNTVQSCELEPDLQFLKTSLENKESINEEELLEIFKPFKKYLQKELEGADLLWYFIKLTVDFPITIVRSTSIPSPSSSPDLALDLEDNFSVPDKDGVVETNTGITEYVQDNICDIPEQPVETHPAGDEIFGDSIEVDESVLPTLNKEVEQWHKYLAPIIEEIQGQRKKAEVPATFNRKIVSAFTSENRKTTLPLKDILKSQSTDDYPITFVSVLHMANNKQLKLHVSLPTGRDFLLDECDVTLTKHRLSTASMDESDSEVPEKRRCY